MNKINASLNFKTIFRQYSVTSKPKILVDEELLNKLNNKIINPKRHPGIIKHKTVSVPDSFLKSVTKALEDYPVKALLTASETLGRHLKGRVPPMEVEDIKNRSEKYQKKFLSKIEKIDDENEHKIKQSVNHRTKHLLKKKIYNWKPVNYDNYNSLLYLLSRSSAEYSVLVRIFGEIVHRDEQFQPRSLFDFGSGTGTASWAANFYWKGQIFEYYNVDSSGEMNDLALILLQGGTGTGILPKGVFYRQFLPAANNMYDLVISAYSMLELPSLQARLNTVLNLWNRTSKYLVLVERGTNAGFKVINEVRDFVLQIQEPNEGHVFSPCPHDNSCPRFLLDDGTPCNFEVGYMTMPIGGASEFKRELYSYVILKKGKRDAEDESTSWPRVVRPILVRHKHCVCRLCTASGKLEEVVFTSSKHGKAVYHCARSTEWGDRIPFKIQSVSEPESESERKSDSETTEQ